MRKVIIQNRTGLHINDSYEGEPMEIYLARVTETNEPIEATDSLICTDRDEGALPEYDIRTDRWEIAREAMDAVSRNAIAKRKGIKPEVTTGNEGELPEQSTELKQSNTATE